MYWMDVLVGRPAEHRDLARALGEALGVSPEAVTIVDDSGELAGRRPADEHVMAVRIPVGGEMALLLRVFIPNPVVAHRVADEDRSAAAVRRFAAAVGADCLIEGDEPSDEICRRVRPSGAVETVIVDGDRLADDEYVVVGPAARVSA